MADLECIQMIDISALCIHPACVISVTLTALKSEPRYSEQKNNSFVLNVSGRLLLVNQQDELFQVIKMFHYCKRKFEPHLLYYYFYIFVCY